MGYDRGDSILFDLESNRFSFGSKSKGKLSPRSYPIHLNQMEIHLAQNRKGKLSPRSYPIQFEMKWNTSFLRVQKSSEKVLERLSSLGSIWGMNAPLKPL